LRRVLVIVFGVLLFCLAFTGTGYATTSNAATYTVQPDDTFYLIALQYGITADQLMAANGDASSCLSPGQVLTIPQVNADNNQYTVVAGDTLFQIAQEYGTTLDTLAALNHLTPDSQGDVDIYPGQVLQLPGSQSAAASGTGGVTWTQQYTVRAGDTLEQIAQQCGASPGAIIAGNHLTDMVLYPGQQLLLPNGANSPQASRAEVTPGDTYLLAQLINAEAEGEPFEGQVAVGAVVLNRLLDPSFPKTIKDVILQHNSDLDTYQFEPVENGAINEQPCPSAVQAADAALSGWDPTGGALYFYNPVKTASDFFDSALTYLKQIGNHLFYK
jgi:N-acetylmuramoyl-L-alanine amidase